MSQVYSITFNGIGDAATVPLNAAAAVRIASDAVRYANATPRLFLSKSELATLDQAKSDAMNIVIAPQVEPSTLDERARTSSGHIWELFQAARKRRMLYLGVGAAAVGLGGYLYFRKR